MRNPKTISANEQLELIKRLKNGSQAEIRTYISSLKQSFGKYGQSLHARRKIIDSATLLSKITLTESNGR